MTATNNIVKPYRVKDFVHTPKSDKGELTQELEAVIKKIGVMEFQELTPDEADQLKLLWNRKRYLLANLFPKS